MVRPHRACLPPDGLTGVGIVAHGTTTVSCWGPLLWPLRNGPGGPKRPYPQGGEHGRLVAPTLSGPLGVTEKRRCWLHHLPQGALDGGGPKVGARRAVLPSRQGRGWAPDAALSYRRGRSLMRMGWRGRRPCGRSMWRDASPCSEGQPSSWGGLRPGEGGANAGGAPARVPRLLLGRHGWRCGVSGSRRPLPSPLRPALRLVGAAHGPPLQERPRASGLAAGPTRGATPPSSPPRGRCRRR
mgnify:CR=1 FL=1